MCTCVDGLQLASAVEEELVHQTAPSRLDYIKASFQVLIKSYIYMCV